MGPVGPWCHPKVGTLACAGRRPAYMLVLLKLLLLLIPLLLPSPVSGTAPVCWLSTLEEVLRTTYNLLQQPGQLPPQLHPNHVLLFNQEFLPDPASKGCRITN